MKIGDSPVKKSTIPGEIIKVLQKERSFRFKELKDRLQISGPTLSIHLKSLINEDIIKFEKRGREKHYSLSKNASKIFESQSALLSIMLTSMYDVSPKKFKSLSELLGYISDSAGFMFLFILLQSFKTGKNWTVSFDSSMLFQEAADLLVYGMFEKNVDVEKLRLNLHNNPNSAIQEISELSKKKKNGPLINELLELLEEKDPNRFQNLKESFKHSMTEYED
jgi:DNA-binding MarR family transcriptional regulator